MTDARHADRLVAEGNLLGDTGDVTGAEQKYLEAARHAASWFVPHYNLGLLYKNQGRWRESQEANGRAVELAPDDQDAWWNLGIAATAMGDWSAARRAWEAIGLDVPPGDGPPEFDLGQTPIRLDPEGDAEVVWARRLDPARGRIVSIPLPSSAYHFGDVILHDGAPEGYRIVSGAQYPVFNALTRLERSPFRKFIVELATSDERSIEALESIADALGGAAEYWGQSTRVLCRECSLGTPHEHHGSADSPAHPSCGLAARDEAHAQQMLSRWLADHPSADLVTWYEAAP